MSLGNTTGKPQANSNGLGYGTDSDSDSSITKQVLRASQATVVSQRTIRPSTREPLTMGLMQQELMRS